MVCGVGVRGVRTPPDPGPNCAPPVDFAFSVSVCVCLCKGLARRGKQEGLRASGEARKWVNETNRHCFGIAFGEMNLVYFSGVVQEVIRNTAE